MDDDGLRSALPVRTTAELDGLRIGLVHDGGAAVGRHERLRELFAGCDVVAYGHSHMPEVSRVEGVWILNPGSPTERRRAPGHTMIVIRDGEPELVPVRA
jgi:putative phosphoesterase